MTDKKKNNDCPGNPLPAVSINAGRLIYEMYNRLLHLTEEIAIIKNEQSNTTKDISWLKKVMWRLLFLFIGLLIGIIVNLIAILVT